MSTLNPIEGASRVTEAFVVNEACADSATTSLITSLSTLYGTELIALVVSDQDVTFVIRKFGVQTQIYSPATTPVTANTVSTAALIKDDDGLGQSVDILITNASGSTATVTLWVGVRP